MISIFGSRQTGKTSRLVKIALANNGVIVVSDLTRKRSILNNFDIDKERVITADEYLNKRRIIKCPLYVDELTNVAQYLFENNLRGYTISSS